MSTLAIPLPETFRLPVASASCGHSSGVLLLDSDRWNLIAHTGGALKDRAARLVSKYGGSDDVVIQLYNLAADLENLIRQSQDAPKATTDNIAASCTAAKKRKLEHTQPPCTTVAASFAGPSFPVSVSSVSLGPSSASSTTLTPPLSPSISHVPASVVPSTLSVPTQLTMAPLSLPPLTASQAIPSPSVALQYIRAGGSSPGRSSSPDLCDAAAAETATRLTSLAAAAIESERDSDSFSGDTTSDDESRDGDSSERRANADPVFQPRNSMSFPRPAAVKSEAPGKKPRCRRVRAKAASKDAPLFCHSCGETQTCEWRRGPDGFKSLCNACGIHFAKIVKREEKAFVNYRPRESVDVKSLLN